MRFNIFHLLIGLLDSSTVNCLLLSLTIFQCVYCFFFKLICRCSLIYMCVLEISSSPRHILHLSGVFLLYRIYNFNVISSLVGKNKDSYPSSVSSLLCNLGLLS